MTTDTEVPLVIQEGNLQIGAAEGGSLTNYSTAITEVMIAAAVDTVQIPATLATPKANRGGAADYSITFSYLSNDISGSFFQALWTAVLSASKELYFEVSLRDGPISSTNPVWSGTFVVTAATVGAAVSALSTGQATFPMTGQPSFATSQLDAGDSVAGYES